MSVQRSAAVQHAHERGIRHCDLNQGNILLASGGRKSPDSAAESGDLRPPLASIRSRTRRGGLFLDGGFYVMYRPLAGAALRVADAGAWHLLFFSCFPTRTRIQKEIAMPRSRPPRHRNAAAPFRGYRVAESDAEAAAGLRSRAEGMLREVAFVLHLTRTLKDALVNGGRRLEAT